MRSRFAESSSLAKRRRSQQFAGPHAVARASAREVLMVTTVLLLVGGGGCRSLSREGPVPRSVASCRQMSQQGINAMERGDWKRAESLLVRALQTCPSDVEARRNYAEVLWHRGAQADAVAQVEEARRVATDDTGLAVRAGEMYLALGKMGRARQAAEQALDLDPKCAPAWALRGNVLERSGDYRQALADYQRSLGYAPGSPEVLLRLAEAYRQVGVPSRALATLQSLIDTYPPGEEPQNLLYLQGLALIALQRYNDAVESLTLANQRGPHSAELQYQLAQAHLLAGRPADAQAALQQALALEPAHQPSLALVERMRAGQPATATRTGPPLNR
jgi:tetratricopeptide (TPR) repeat protein